MAIEYKVFGKTIMPQFKSSEKLTMCDFSIGSAVRSRKITVRLSEIFPISLIGTLALPKKIQLIINQFLHQSSNLKLTECCSFIIQIKSEVALLFASHLTAISENIFRNTSIKRNLAIMSENYLEFSFSEHKQNTY